MIGRNGFIAPRVQRSAWFTVLLGALSVAACGSSDNAPQQPANGGAPSGAGSGGAPPVGGSGAPTAAGSTGISGSGAAHGGASGAAGSSGQGGANSGAGGSVPGAGASGAAGSGSNAGAGGMGTKQVACDFASGLNVAWVNFANDVPNPDLNSFKTIFQNTHAAGGRIIRWWFHTNGSVTPGYDSDGKALALAQSHTDGVKAILKAADDAGVALVISLWSFDMLQDNAGTAYTNNQALLEKDENRQAYVDRYLTPLVTALKGSKGLYAWEIFNEPEGMSPTGWATHKTTMPAIQKTVNWLAAAIHTADPNVLVTSSAVTFDYCSKISGKQNYYSDDALRTVGGKQNGTLDFYQVHYYTQNGISNSAFKHPASYWGLDKKLVLGEFAPADTDGVLQNALGTYLYDNGYNGGWAWSYDADWKWPAEQGPLQALYTAHADVGNCPKAQVALALPQPNFAAQGVRSLPTLAELSSGAQTASKLIHTLAAAGDTSRARAEAEDMVNRYPDSDVVREVERFTGAHRHRNLRTGADGQLTYQ